ncbi:MULTISPECIES: tetratricopeptide repeat protein [unclassified Streptomyces]|uniref:tetratricopeptide repeat protein n=1 Tax=unclassified Streptomyces TaxID=2593676 RepID=UPI0029A7665A|nr:tetratricopeptide repeat protein [Streptomyces sp. DK15]MDX2389472.1 tetratricopeptide repeat protein [Streptomyces sp. DK15]
MRLFRWRRRNDAGQMAGTPFAQTAVLYRAGRYAEAEAEARSVAAGPFRPRHAHYGPLAMGIAAVTVGAQGRHADAVTMFDELLPAFVRDYGSEHRYTLKLRSDRAQELAALGLYGECEAECAAVAQLADRGTGPDMQFIAAGARNGQVHALAALGRHVEAEVLVRLVLATHFEPDPLRLVLRLALADSLSGQGRHAEALAEVQRADVMRRSLSEGDYRPATGTVDLAAATALFGLGRGTEAQPRAAAAYDACLAVFGPDHYRTCKAKALLDRIDGA